MRNSTTYKLAGTRTFRRASTKILKKWGSNLQNIEKSMRSIYIPDGFSKDLEGRCKYWLSTQDISVFNEEELLKLNVFVQRDQAGAEALIVAFDCEAADYRQLFLYDIKPHVYVALRLFQDTWKQEATQHGLKITDEDITSLVRTPIKDIKSNVAWHDINLLIKSSDDWPANKRYYYLAKQTVHSANYDIRAAMFIMNILEKSGGIMVLDKEQGEYFLNTYRSLFPEIPERNRRIRQQIDKTKILYNFFGFPYTITNYNITEETYKEYYAWGPQSTVGEITRIAICELQEYIEANHKRWDILQDNHDSYMTQGSLVDVKERIEKMGEFMNQELESPIDGTKFSMKSEFQVGFNWGPYKPGKNELGLREIKI